MHIRWSYGKYKVSIGYDTDKVPRSVEAVVNSTQLSEEVDQESQLAPAIGRVVIAPVLEQLAAQGLDTSGVVTHINPSGRFVIGDRKSTRLNSSHVAISYAVFCLKKKNSSSDSCFCSSMTYTITSNT